MALRTSQNFALDRLQRLPRYTSIITPVRSFLVGSTGGRGGGLSDALPHAAGPVSRLCTGSVLLKIQLHRPTGMTRTLRTSPTPISSDVPQFSVVRSAPPLPPLSLSPKHPPGPPGRRRNPGLVITKEYCNATFDNPIERPWEYVTGQDLLVGRDDRFPRLSLVMRYRSIVAGDCLHLFSFF